MVEASKFHPDGQTQKDSERSSATFSGEDETELQLDGYSKSGANDRTHAIFTRSGPD